MQLKVLEIQGFKSFPDRTRLTFGPGITAVVGPNGSGKSNISDAVRWVLGEQSSRTLRGAKMEDVIFGGTQTRRSQGYAFVSLTIDNRDRALPMEEDEVTVSRKLYRSGESEYRIGSAQVRLRDVYELFLDTGLGRDGYSVIGQGKIAEIVSAKDSDRREIFEEAAGIAKFRFRRTEAERRLAAARENLDRLRDILGELERRVEPLRQESEKAKEFLVLAGEKKTLEISLWMDNLRKARALIRAEEDKILVEQSRRKELDGEIAGVEAEIAALYQKMQEASVKAEEARSQVKSREEAAAARTAEIAVCENNREHNQQAQREIAAQLEESGQAGAESEQAIAALESLMQEKSAALDALRQEGEALGRELAASQEEGTAIQREIDRQRALRDAVYLDVSKAGAEKDASASLLEEARARIEEGARQDFASLLAEVEAQLAQAKEDLTALEEEASGLENTGKGYRLRLERKAAKREELLAQRQKWEDQLREKSQRARLLEDLENSMEGFAQSVKYIVKQGKKGLLQGIVGPVFQLIAAKGEHALAIETALGGAMQNIVAEDEEAAKAAIRQLSRDRAGRATFLPRTSVKGNRLDVRSLSRQAGFVGLAADLVTYDPRFEGVVAWLLGRVVVAEDLDAAVAIAKGARYQFRVVSLDGQVVNAGGSLTGGSTAKSAGALSRRTEIETLTQEVSALNAKIGELEKKLLAAQGEIGRDQAELTALESRKKTLSEDAIRLESRLQRLTQRRQELREARDFAQGETQRLSARAKELEGQNQAAHRLLEELTARLSEVEIQLETALLRKEKHQGLLGELQDRLSKNSLSALAAEKDVEQLSGRRDQLRQQRENQASRGQELTARAEALVGENAAIGKKIEELKSQRAHSQRQAEEFRGNILGLMAQRESWEGETTQLRGREKELSAKREDSARSLARLEEHRLNLQGSYDSVIQRLWDEYEVTRTEAEALAQPVKDLSAAQHRLQELKGKIKALGSVNLGALEEYEEVSGRYRALKGQVEDVTQSEAELSRQIGSLTREMREIFAASFQKIADQFSKVFTELFGGGRASLSLTGEDVLECGIEIAVQPPGKVIKNLSALSGGEQAFVAIAIYFAILTVNPAPFCLLDEIEAALDDVNVDKFARYLRRLCGKTQFIAITHRRGTMEEADVLYGVTMQEEGVSKLLELKVSELESKLGMK
ncbi:chromosome segregation protein SMC [Merdimmobilis hominis]|uniref:chromosome segregation protein SMC n=1 Tax=Merdimmobilis hominis TaxID=2897707 RepID=UPI0008F93226|nr:chromosome segregation protein SMC [Merdimmobilis hominis]